MYDFNEENVFINWGQAYTSERNKINNILDINGKTIVGVEQDIYFEEMLKMISKFAYEAVTRYGVTFQSLPLCGSKL